MNSLIHVARPGFALPAALLWFCCLLLSPLTLAAQLDPPLRADLNEQVIRVPIPSLIGSVELETTVYRPDGPGPFPLVVINHGLNYGGGAWQSRERYPLMAEEFLKRGYAVALPMRRGFAGSSGTYTETGCSSKGSGKAAADDIAEAITWLQKQPWVDGSRILVAGQSHGGLASLALADKNIPGVKAILNFAGGVRMRNDDFCRWESILKDTFADYGQNAKVDSLWFYGANDTLFEPPLVQELYKRYTEAGGKAELVTFGPFGTNAHLMFGTQTGFDDIWWPKAKPFLAAHGLPVDIVYPDRYNALPTPPASGFADPHDVAAVPLIGPKCREIYSKQFDHQISPKSFAISDKGACGWIAGYDDDPVAAMLRCQSVDPSVACHLYRINDNVVWEKAK